MNKKFTAVIIAALFVAVLLVAYNSFLAPKGEEGTKDIAIQVAVEKENIDKTFNYKTDKEFLGQLIEEKKKELGTEYEDSQYGKMIKAMMNYKAKESEKEYFHITINNEDAQTGIDGITIKDNDAYRFELKKY